MQPKVVEDENKDECIEEQYPRYRQKRGQEKIHDEKKNEEKNTVQDREKEGNWMGPEDQKNLLRIPLRVEPGCRPDTE